MSEAGFAIMGYYTNWSIYARQFPPKLVPFNKLSHVLYAFANCEANGSVVLTDSWADTDKHFEDDPWTGPPTALYGCLNKLGIAKRQNRNLKLLLSIGGWTLSANFAAVAADEAKRSQFVKTSIQLVEDLGLDGIDIDWEYPASVAEGQSFLALLTELRAGLNDYMRQKQDLMPYLITIACSCGPSHYSMLPLGKMAAVVDFFNLMAYDFAGSFTTYTGHQAKLFGDEPAGSAAVTDYVLAGVPASKIILGLPIYGRSFANTSGGPGQTYSGVGPGSWEPGVYDYKALPLAGSQEVEDASVVAASCYNPGTREWVTYDTANVIRTKCNWAVSQKLGGVMFWELSADKAPPQSLVDTAWQVLSARVAAQENHINYPKSKYDNIRTNYEGMYT